MLVRRLATLAVASLAMSGCAGTPSATLPPSTSSATTSSATTSSRAVTGTESLLDSCRPGEPVEPQRFFDAMDRGAAVKPSRIRLSVAVEGNLSWSFMGDLNLSNADEAAFALTTTGDSPQRMTITRVGGVDYVTYVGDPTVYTAPTAAPKTRFIALDPAQTLQRLRPAATSVVCHGVDSGEGEPFARYQVSLEESRLANDRNWPVGFTSATLDVRTDGRLQSVGMIWPSGSASVHNLQWGPPQPTINAPTGTMKSVSFKNLGF